MEQSGQPMNEDFSQLATMREAKESSQISLTENKQVQEEQETSRVPLMNIQDLDSS